MTIQEDIKKNGFSFFENLRSFIVEEATKPNPYDRKHHEINQNLLIKKIEVLCKESEFNSNLTTDGLWKLIYERIFYSGTRASKATAEIRSVEHYGFFNDFRELENDKWNFDIKEWDDFVKYWKDKVFNKSKWLSEAKLTNEWIDSKKHFFSISGENSINLMNKEGIFEGVKFSAMSSKMAKYIKAARFLIEFEKVNPKDKILYYFIGNNYNFEKDKFWDIHKKFSDLVGDITALHLMMDLGFKTVKPDRVLTYLFSKIGWLEVFPKNSSKEYILKNYMKKKVWEDVINKSILLGKELENKYANPLRQLDIWIVKYGQEPEQEFGITQNLEKKFSIEDFYKKIQIKNGG